jgi:hypothetical protein
MRSVLGAPVTEANAAQQLLLLSSLGDFVKSEQSRVELLQHQARRAQRTASVRCAQQCFRRTASSHRCWSIIYFSPEQIKQRFGSRLSANMCLFLFLLFKNNVAALSPDCVGCKTCPPLSSLSAPAVTRTTTRTRRRRTAAPTASARTRRRIWPSPAARPRSRGSRAPTCASPSRVCFGLCLQGKGNHEH